MWIPWTTVAAYPGGGTCDDPLLIDLWPAQGEVVAPTVRPIVERDPSACGEPSFDLQQADGLDTGARDSSSPELYPTVQPLRDDLFELSFADPLAPGAWRLRDRADSFHDRTFAVEEGAPPPAAPAGLRLAVSMERACGVEPVVSVVVDVEFERAGSGLVTASWRTDGAERGRTTHLVVAGAPRRLHASFPGESACAQVTVASLDRRVVEEGPEACAAALPPCPRTVAAPRRGCDSGGGAGGGGLVALVALAVSRRRPPPR